MKLKFTTATLFLLLVTIGLASAGSISLTDPTIPSSVVQGGSFSLVMRVSGSSVQNVEGTVSPPSGISCTPSTAQSITISDGSGSASWSCTGNTAGDYTNQITLSVSATDSGTGGALSDTSTTGLVVQSPASLVVTSSVNSTLISTSQGVNFTVSINNNGDASTSVNITVYANSSNANFATGNLTGITVNGDSLVTRTWYVSSGTAGTYQLFALVQSVDTGNSTTNRNVSVSASGDVTAPSVSINTPANNSNQSSTTLTLNFSATDAASALSSCWYSVNGTANVTVAGCISGSSNSTSVTVVEGAIQNITAYANDTSNNVGSATRYFNIDRTPPTITTVTNGTVTSSTAVITWTTNQSSNSTVSYGTASNSLGSSSTSTSNVTSHSISLSGLTASTTYYYNVTSCDTAANCNTSGPNSFITGSAAAASTSSGGGGGGAGAASSNASAAPVIALTVEAGKVGILSDFESISSTRRVSVAQGGQVVYKYINTQHKVVVDKVTATSVTLTLSSSPITVTMTKGQEKTFDVTGDKQDDIKIKIVDINATKVIMDVTRVAASSAVTSSEKKPAITTPSAQVGGQLDSQTAGSKATQEVAAQQALQSSNLPLIVVAVVVVLALVYFFIVKKAGSVNAVKKPKKQKDDDESDEE